MSRARSEHHVIPPIARTQPGTKGLSMASQSVIGGLATWRKSSGRDDCACGWKDSVRLPKCGRDALLQFCPRGTHAEPEQSSPAVERRENPNPREVGPTGCRSEGSGRCRSGRTEVRAWTGNISKAEAYVRGCSQTDCCRPARALGQMESG